MPRAYDHRLRGIICATRDLALAARLGVPRRTAKTWLRRGKRDVVTSAMVEPADALALRQRVAELELRVARLKGRLAVLLAMLRLLLGVLRALGVRPLPVRIPTAEAKAQVLAALARARPILGLALSVRVAGISPSRASEWRVRAACCSLVDRSSCPRSTPSRLSFAERHAVHDLVTSADLRHLPLGTLAVHAQRIGQVFAHPSTWARLVRDHGWRRPRLRVHPPKPTVGIRAEHPGELVHIDVTVFRLLDGSKAFLHAVLDNCSRRILAWRLAPRLDPANTCAVLATAATELGRLDNVGDKPTETVLLADSGVENVNGQVDRLLERHPLRRVLAQVEIAYSNSMIEAWWRSLKHQWLFLNSLDSIATLEKLVAFYVEQHNTVMPHSAFRGVRRGATPDEVFFGRADGIADHLREASRVARERRLESNRALACADCHAGSDPPSVATPERDAA